MPNNTFYATTAIPYVNGDPHVGHVLEWFQADAIARYHKSLGKDVVLNSGSDENSLKNVQAAEKAEVPVQDWLDQYSAIFEKAYQTFGINLDTFRRGSDQKLHWPGVQKLWEACFANGDMYKKSYTGLYCVGCESFYTQEELVDGNCPEHLKPPEKITEENYFFRLSKYQDQIKKLIESNELLIVSDQFRNEMLGFINQGLEDFSVSRPTSRARDIGVPVPNDPDQVMYVWFDALSIYLTSLGYGLNDSWKNYWPADVHVIGKGINRFHSIYWIGMLLSAGLPTPKAVSVHGYVTANGQKMGKSLGNVLDPFELKDKYGLEPLRYYLLKFIPTHADGDFSHEQFAEVYTADLANGLGNLCSRVATLCAKNGGDFEQTDLSYNQEFTSNMEKFELSQAAGYVQTLIAEQDAWLAKVKPWTQTGAEQQATLQKAVTAIRTIAWHLQAFMPETSQTILEHFSQTKISKITPLFPRLDA